MFYSPPIMSTIKARLFREGCALQKWMTLQKSFKGGREGGSLPLSQIYILSFLGATFDHEIMTKCTSVNVPQETFKRNSPKNLS